MVEITKEDKIQLKLGFYDQLIFGECYFKINNEEPVILRLDPRSKEVQELINKIETNND